MNEEKKDIEIALAIKEFVLANLHKRFSPNQLAIKFSVSTKFIKTKLRVLLGDTLAHIIKEERMKQAVVLIKEGHTNRYIALKLGYSSAQHFLNAFRKYYKSYPNKYLKKK
jgi:AraC family transcriptional regulator, transcriptional activator of the genes for pyochelin and ferripyochelin receptors